MEKLEIKRNILVKAIVTEELKTGIIGELQDGISKIEAELKFIEQRSKKTITELTLKGSPQVAAVREQIEYEKLQREDAKEKMVEQINLISSWEPGQEVVQEEIEGPVEVRVGDHWDEIMGREIVIKNGRIIAIR